MYRTFILEFVVGTLFLFCSISSYSFSNEEATKNSSGIVNRSQFTDQDDTVIERYWKILLDRPAFGPVFDRVYYHYTEKHSVNALIQKIEKLIKTFDSDHKENLSLLLGLVYIRQNDLVQAVAKLQEVHRIAPHNFYCSIQLGKTLILQGYLQKGADILDNVLQEDIPQKERIAVSEILGETWLRLDMPEKTETVWNTIINDHEVDLDTLARLAAIREKSGQYRNALTLYEKMAKIARVNNQIELEIKYLLAAVDMRIRVGEKKEAIKECEHLLDSISGESWIFSQVRDRIEYLFLQQSDYNALLDYYQEREKFHPNDIDCIERQAVILSGLGRLDDAMKSLYRGIKKAPSNVSLRKTLIELQLIQNNYDKAEILYEEINSLEPDNPDTLLAWGICVLHNPAITEPERRKHAVNLWKQLLETRKNDRSTILLVAQTMIDQGIQEDAEQLLQKLVTLFPDDPSVYEQLAEFYFNNESEHKAFALLDQMTSGKRNNIEMFLRKANLLYTNNYWREASSSVKMGLKLDPVHFDANRLLLDILVKNGEYTGIDAIFDRADTAAKNDDEKVSLFSLRLQYLQDTNAIGSYLNQLNASLDSSKPETLAELFWKKLMLLMYLEDTETSLNTLLAALPKGAVSSILLQKAKELIDKSNLPDKSLEVLQLLCTNHPAEKTGYLTSIANIQLELGMFEEAASTGKQIVDESPNNGTNYRIYADILLAVGNMDEAISVLQRGMCIDPTDQATLMKLSELLDDSGKTNQAIDIQWQLFQQSTRMEEKLKIIETLAKYYAKSDKFDLFKDRLMSFGKDSVSRRENTCCLARAYTSIQDYSSARSVLDSLLSFSGTHNQEEIFILSQLSALAELQNDLDGAIYYQERICQVNDNLDENERLLALYNRTEDKKRSRHVLLKKIVPKEPVWKQLETVDTLLALEDYKTASDILSALENRYSENWEVLARRMMIAGWTNGPELADLIEKIRRIRIPSETRAMSPAFERDLITNNTILSDTPWRIGNIHDSLMDNTTAPSTLNTLADKLVLTVYRERLTLNNDYYRSSITSFEKTRKPTISFPNFLSAQMAAEAWSIKLSSNMDLPYLKMETKKIEDIPIFDNTYISDNKNISYILKVYVYEQYKKRLSEYSLHNSKSSQMKENDYDNTRLNQIAILLAGTGRMEWYREALTYLTELLSKNGSKEKVDNKTILLEKILESYLADNSKSNNTDIWTKATAAATVLESKGYSKHALEIRKLIDRAQKNDPALSLNMSVDASSIPVTTFMTSIRNTRREAIKQVRNKKDCESVYQKIGDAFAARLKSEYGKAFIHCGTLLPDRISKSAEIWQDLAEKTGYGPRVVKAFIRLKQRILFPENLAGIKEYFDNPSNIKTLDQAVEQYITSAKQIISLATETDRELEEAFSSKYYEKPYSMSRSSFGEIKRYLTVSKENFANIASFLINKAIYEKRETASVAESGSLLETIYGTCFAVDMLRNIVQSSQSKETKGSILTTMINNYVEQEEMKYNKKTASRAYQRVNEVLFLLNERLANASSTVQLPQLEEKAKKTLQRKAGDASAQSLLHAGLILLALLDNREEEAIKWLEQLPCLRFSDVKTRDMCYLDLFPVKSGKMAEDRKNDAINRLMGYRLDEDEAMKFYTFLQRENRKKEAEKIYNRLLRTVTKEKNMTSLFDIISIKHKNKGRYSEEEINFALRVFRSPLWNFGIIKEATDIRKKSLVVLTEAGKLNEVRHLIERQVSAAPGSFDILMQLAELDIAQGQISECKEVIKIIEKHLPSDPVQMINFAGILSQVDEIKQAKQLLKKAFSCKPELFFDERGKFSFWDAVCDIEFISMTDQNKLVPYSYKVTSILLQHINKTLSGEKAFNTLCQWWNAKSLDSVSRQAVQSAAIRLLGESKDERFFPLAKNWFLEMIQYQDAKTPVISEYQDIHRLTRWNEKHPVTLSWSFLNMTQNRSELNSLLEDVVAISQSYQKDNEVSPLRASASAVFEIQILVRLEKYDRAISRLKEMMSKEYFCDLKSQYDSLAITIAFNDHCTKYPDVFLPLFERGYEANPHPVYEPYFVSHLCLLRLLSQNEKIKHEGLLLSLKKLKEVFHFAVHGDTTKNHFIASSVYNVSALQLYLDTLGKTLVETGERESVRKIINETGFDKHLNDSVRLEKMTPEWKKFILTAQSLTKTNACISPTNTKEK